MINNIKILEYSIKNPEKFMDGYYMFIEKHKDLDLYVNQKLSMDDIADCLETGKTTIARYLKYYKIPSRSLKSARKNYFSKLI